MDVGIIVLSLTGNTLQVAEQLQDKLNQAGHDAAIVRMEARMESGGAVLVHAPDLPPQGALVFASPVHAFHLARPMKQFLDGMPDLGGRPFGVFATEQLPFPWFGGNRAVRTMTKIAQQKNGMPLGSGVVNWSRKDRPDRIRQVTDLLAEQITAQQ